MICPKQSGRTGEPLTSQYFLTISDRDIPLWDRGITKNPLIGGYTPPSLRANVERSQVNTKQAGSGFLTTAFKDIMSNFEGQLTKIARARKSRGLTQRYVCSVAKINREAYICWENTGKEPMLRPSQIAALLELLGCELSDIVDLDDVAA